MMLLGPVLAIVFAVFPLNFPRGLAKPVSMREIGFSISTKESALDGLDEAEAIPTARSSPESPVSEYSGTGALRRDSLMAAYPSGGTPSQP